MSDGIMRTAAHSGYVVCLLCYVTSVTKSFIDDARAGNCWMRVLSDCPRTARTCRPTSLPQRCIYITFQAIQALARNFWFGVQIGPSAAFHIFSSQYRSSWGVSHSLPECYISNSCWSGCGRNISFTVKLKRPLKELLFQVLSEELKTG